MPTAAKREIKTRRGQNVLRRPLPPDVLAYRVPDAAVRLGVSTATVWRMVARGDIEARKIGAATIIRREALMAYVEGAALVTKADQ